MITYIEILSVRVPSYPVPLPCTQQHWNVAEWAQATQTVFAHPVADYYSIYRDLKVALSLEDKAS